ncbi:hypothetical protein HDU76_003689 [Blyttiomyces sp. JEL0837]|nr:hypothetical protein HDU76_003689 [Blyttiomyces sp. JEL0837]
MGLLCIDFAKNKKNIFAVDMMNDAKDTNRHKRKPNQLMEEEVRVFRNDSRSNPCWRFYDIVATNRQISIGIQERTSFEMDLLAKFRFETLDFEIGDFVKECLMEEFLFNRSEAFVQSAYSMAIQKLVPSSIECRWGEDLPVPISCLPGNVPGKPDMVYFSGTVGIFDSKGDKTVHVPLICGEFTGHPYSVDSVAPQAVWAAMSAILTMLTLDNHHEDIAIPIFTASCNQFRFYILTVLVKPKFQFRLHSVDNINVRFWDAISPRTQTQHVVAMFHCFKLHAEEMAKRIANAEIGLRATGEPEDFEDWSS